MHQIDHLPQKAKDLGAFAAAVIDTADVKFMHEFRKACERNACGFYDKNWMCPPAVGAPAELEERFLQFQQGFVIQSVHSIKSSFDSKGMIKAVDDHEKVFRSILNYIESNENYESLLPLNVGACRFCKECSYLTGQPCRIPEKAVASLEAYCIDVNALLGKCDIPYYNGPNTVSFVSLFLLS